MNLMYISMVELLEGVLKYVCKVKLLDGVHCNLPAALKFFIDIGGSFERFALCQGGLEDLLEDSLRSALDKYLFGSGLLVIREF